MEVHAHAKINWSLRITGKRADGFHDLETVFQTIALHDTLIFRESNELTLRCDDPSIPIDETNLVLRAARALGKTAAIELRKRIPAGGGLGGGSSDAAATLRALGGDREDLPQLALSLGSDVPFFLLGGTAYATGRGEILVPLPPIHASLLLVLPEERVLTRDAFARITRYSPALGNAGVLAGWSGGVPRLARRSRRDAGVHERFRRARLRAAPATARIQTAPLRRRRDVGGDERLRLDDRRRVCG